jgi:hypothetical protein
LLVLAHLRRRWSLSSREGFGFLSPSRQACKAGFGAFVEVKRLFSTVPKVREEMEANGGHRGDRTWSRFDRMRPVSSTQQSGVRVLGFATGVSDPSWNQSVRLGTQRSIAWQRADRTRGASGHTRSDVSGSDGSSLDRDWMLALSRPVVSWSVSSRLSGMSGQLRLTVGAQ